MLEVVLGEWVYLLISPLQKFILHQHLVFIHLLIHLHYVFALEWRFHFSLCKRRPIKALEPLMVFKLFCTLFWTQSGQRLTDYQFVHEINRFYFISRRKLSLLNCMLFWKYCISYLVTIVSMIRPLKIKHNVLCP